MRILACIAFVSALAFSAAAADLTGKWSGTYTPDNGNGSNTFCTLKQSGTKVTGTAGHDAQTWPVENGTVQGNKVTFEVKPDNSPAYKCELTAGADTLSGTCAAHGPNGGSSKGKLELSRAK